jgi:hypothetical protein
MGMVVMLAQHDSIEWDFSSCAATGGDGRASVTLPDGMIGFLDR